MIPYKAVMKTSAIVSCIAGMLVAAWMMSAAWQHNSQNEIYLDQTINWSYWLLIGFSWFLPVFIISSVLELLFNWLIRRHSTIEQQNKTCMATPTSPSVFDASTKLQP